MGIRTGLGFWLGAVAITLGAGCGGGGSAPRPVRMAVTTSTANTGLIDYLMAAFMGDTGIRVDCVVTGTGKAITHGQSGDVDVILVHAPPAEEQFVAGGFGVERVPVMWNDFIVLGPPGDPAGIGESANAADALKALATARAPFVSRGDDSGTHKKERRLWQAAGIDPQGTWYVEAGQGMGACLTMANDKLAYVLCDRGTYLAMREQLDLGVAYEGDPELINPYAIIAVSPERFPDLNHSGAQQLITWFTSPRGQKLIADFRVNGAQLFHLFKP